MTEDAPGSARPVNVAALLRERAIGPDADRTAVIEAEGAGGSRTWRELDADVESLASGLSSLGLVAGQRVAFALPNSLCLVTTYLAVLRAGLVAVPMNPRSATGELVRMVADSGARVVVGDASTAPALRTAVEAVREAVEGAGESVRARAAAPTLVVHDAQEAQRGELRWEELASRGTSPVVSPSDRERLAVLLYTSGTSGHPRGAMLSHRALLANVAQVGALDPPAMTGDDVVLGLLPLFHVYGLNAVLGQVLATGAQLVLLERFEPEETLRVVAEHAVTNLPVAPPVVAAWAGRPDLADRMRSVRLVVCGAAPLDPELAALVTEATGLEVERGYGLTETSPVVSSTLASRARAAGAPPDPDGVGGPLPGVEVRVVDGTDDVSPGDPGEIRVRGDNLFSGYWPDGVEGPDADGWWSTGDLAVLDPYGDLLLVDRLRELVIVSGFNVYPSEVESVVAEVDGVGEVAVIGLPDEQTGEAVVAYVVAADPGVGTTDALVERVRSHCEHRLARFKQPGRVVVVDGLPHSATGKVAKGRLRAMGRDALGLA